MELKPGYYWYNNKSWDGEPDGIAYLDSTGRWQYPGREHYHEKPTFILDKVPSRQIINEMLDAYRNFLAEIAKCFKSIYH